MLLNYGLNSRFSGWLYIIVLISIVGLASCNREAPKSEIKILDIEWAVANISSTIESPARAAIRFSVKIEHVNGYENISDVSFWRESGHFFEVYREGEYSKIEVIDSNTAWFHSVNWLYNYDSITDGSGGYSVEVRINGEFNRFEFPESDQIIELESNLESVNLNGSIDFPNLIDPVDILSFSVDQNGLDVAYSITDEREASHQITFFDHNLLPIASSHVFNSTIADNNRRFGYEDLVSQKPFLIRDIAYVEVVSSNHIIEVGERYSGLYAYSNYHLRDTYIPNSPPYLSFTHLASSIYGYAVNKPINFDATSSSDVEDESSELKIRWDWDGDGIFDTEYSSSKTISHSFSKQGSYIVYLEIADTDGGVALSGRRIDITKSAGEMYEMDHDAEIGVLDAPNNVLYSLDTELNRLVKTSILDGSMLGVIELNRIPTVIKMSEDSTKLYIAGLHNEFDSRRPEEDEASDVFTIDLLSFQIENVITVNQDINDMVVTETGFMFATGGNQYSREKVKGFNLSDGSLIDSISTPYTSSRLSIKLLKGEDKLIVYGSRYDYTIFSISDLPEILLVLTNSDPRFSYLSAISDDGCIMLTDDSTVVKCSDIDQTQYDYVTNMGLDWWINSQQIDFDVERSVFYLVKRNYSVGAYNLDTFEYIGEIASDISTINSIWIINEKVVLAGYNREYSKYVLNIIDRPCDGCNVTYSPVAALQIESAGSTSNDYHKLDASASADQDSSSLLYRWDFEGDGEFDTGYSSASSIIHRFILPGEYNATVRVKDESGNISDASSLLTIEKSKIYSSSVPSLLSVEYPSRISFVEYDSSRDRYYIVLKTNNQMSSVLFVDANSRMVTHQFEMPFYVRNIFLRPDNSNLYVVVRDSFKDSDGINHHTGRFAIFDLEDDSLLDFYSELSSSFFDLVATNDGQIVLSTSPYDSTVSNVKLLDSETLTEMHSIDVTPHYYRADLHVDQTRMYRVYTEGNAYQYNFSRIDINENSTLSYSTEALDSLITKTKFNIYFNSSGDRVYDSYGSIFSSSELPQEDMIPIGELSVEARYDAIYDDENNGVILALESSVLRVFDRLSFELIKEVNYGSSLGIFVRGETISFIDDRDIQDFEHPCLGCGSIQ